MTNLDTAVLAWIAGDPDAGDRDELRRLSATPGEAAAAELADRFAGRLSFGTAGLRGAVGAGPNRMNRAVVRAATAAVAAWLTAHRDDARDAGVAIGCDARHRSAEFADEVELVLTGAGIRVHAVPRQMPTPLLAFAVRHLGAAAGIMITASHNPAADNGYKVYAGDGAQILPPAADEIEAGIAACGPLDAVPLGEVGGPLTSPHGDDLVDAYLDALVRLSPGPPAAARLRIVYTPMHGVAGGLFCAALERAGYAPPHVVAAQADPDPGFPTVTFPNPEEPGALDLALADARALGADLVVANDPDGDRLAVAVPEDGWRVLTGDQLGTILGAYELGVTAAHPDPERRLVAASIVSSSLLSDLAAEAGAHYEETLTGFKWIARAGERVEGSRFVFGYEEALGYAIGDVVRDKDGIGAALAVLAIAAEARVVGTPFTTGLDAAERRHGAHFTAQLSVRTHSPDVVMSRLRSDPVLELGGTAVTETIDLLGGGGGLPPTDALLYRMPGERVIIRPSGTEPKLKAYLQVVRQVSGGDLEAARRSAAERGAVLADNVAARLGV